MATTNPNEVLKKHPILRYCAALAMVGLALLFRWLNDPFLEEHFVFVFLFGGLGLSVLIGGWKPATLAAIIGFLVADYFLIFPRNSFHVPFPVLWRLLSGYVISSGIVICLGEMVRRSNQRLQAAADRKAADLTALTELHTLSEKLLNAQESQSMYQDVMDTAVLLMKAPKGTLQIVEGDSLRIVAHHAHDPYFLEYFAEAEKVASVCGEALKKSQRVVIADIEKSDMFRSTRSLEILRKAGIRSIQSTPMISHTGALLGVLTTQWTELHFPDEHELWLLDMLVRQTANLIGRKNAEQALLASEDHLKMETEALAKLNTLGSRLWQIRDFQKGLDEILAAGIEILGADMGNIQLLNSDGRVLRIASHQDSKQDFLDFFREVSSEDTSACGRALRGGQRVVIEDVETDAEYEPLRSVARAAGYRGVQSTPLVGSNGKLIGILSTHWRSPHRSNEQDLRRLNLYVRQAVDFIERFRMDEILRTHADTLAKSNKDLEDFAHMVSHDLQSPLRKIISFGDLVATNFQSNATNALEHLGRMQNSALKMSRLIADLLEYSKATRTSEGFGPVEMRDVVRETLEDLGVQSQGVRLNISTTELPTINARKVHMIQLMTNLIGNAIKYCWKEQATINISARRDGGFWVFRIKDNGIGFDPKQAKQIFNIFHRDHTAGKPGSGIGLAICKKIIEKEGGKIWANSYLGKGSTFYFTLPIREEAKTN